MFEVGEALHGFTVQSREALAEIDGEAIVMHHTSGARLLYLKNDDENKAFSITFNTPPVDDTGVFHILEHSVLCGSRKFPVKEPFVNLLKTSMQTFLNAMTFPDKTMYPVASTNMQDLMNLTAVYLDAVFAPRLYEEREIFEQEGWHYELAGGVEEDDERATGKLSYNGVVFNEMKGALSDPESVLGRAMNRALFPHSCYAFESGGDPGSIPTLTYESYLDAHARHYRPDNSYVVLYGDLDAGRMLAFLDETYESASAFCTQAVPNPIGTFAPQVVDHDLVKMATSPDNAVVGIGYVVGDAHDFERVLACDVLADALMGGNESPIKRALLDAGLGGDCTAYLLSSQHRPVLMFVLRNAKPGVAERFLQVVEETAAKLVAQGIPRDTLEASLSQLAFMLRERDRGIADGVALAINALAGWLYDDADATLYLHYEEPLAHMRAGLDTGFFEKVLDELVCQSTHKALVDIVPDMTEGAGAEAAELAAVEATLTAADKAALRAGVLALRARQEAPDAPEDLAKLPQLHVSDLGKAHTDPAFCLRTDAPLPSLAHIMPTRRIDYFTAYFDLSHLTWDDMPYVSILCLLLGTLGTTGRTPAEVDTWSRSHLGGLQFAIDQNVDCHDANRLQVSLAVSASALSEEVASLAAIPREIWEETQFDDTERIRDALVQKRVLMEQMFLANGHACAMNRVASYLFSAGVMSEQVAGVGFYTFLCDLIDRFDERALDLVARLEALRDAIFARDRFVASFTGSKQDYRAFWQAAGDLGLVCRKTTARLSVPAPQMKREAFVIPGDVVYVARGADLSLQSAAKGAWDVAANALSLDYLWNEVRVKGGAYGCGFRRTPIGFGRFYSFRDPRIDETLARYAKAGDWLAAFDPTDDEMEGYIVSTVASHDAPVKPRVISHRQDADFFAGRPADWREQVRRQILAVTPEQLRGLAPALTQAGNADAICVFGSAAVIDASREDFDRIELMA